MILELENISLNLKGTNILSDISFSLAEQQNLVIFGPNGSGKTMLTTIISGNIPPSSGEVRIMGKSVGDKDLWKLKKTIGFVSPKLFEDFDEKDSVTDVVMSGLFGSIGVLHDPNKKNHQVVKSFIKKITKEKHQGNEKAQELLQFLEIEDLTDHSFHQLSYGQQMRALIARALINEPKLLILDEPTSGLDLKGRAEFMSLLRQLDQRCSLIYITHHLEELLPSMETILMLKEGRLFQFGKISDLVTSEIISDNLDCPLRIKKEDDKYWIDFSSTL